MIEALCKLGISGVGIGDIYNIGSAEEITIKNLADKIMQLTNSSSEIIYKSLSENDPVRRQPDITLAKNILHWNPSIKLDIDKYGLYGVCTKCNKKFTFIFRK